MRPGCVRGNNAYDYRKRVFDYRIAEGNCGWTYGSAKRRKPGCKYSALLRLSPLRTQCP
jgi:hypothetical protein